jgi:hypothetical protein
MIPEESPNLFCLISDIKPFVFFKGTYLETCGEKKKITPLEGPHMTRLL